MTVHFVLYDDTLLLSALLFPTLGTCAGLRHLLRRHAYHCRVLSCDEFLLEFEARQWERRLQACATGCSCVVKVVCS